MSRSGVVRDASDRDLLPWLLEGDPAVRWQVLRDLMGASPERVMAERAKVSTEGWGARLLDAQDSDGCWAGALYSPKWTSTTYTLLLLERLGLLRHDPRLGDGGWNCESIRSGSVHGSFHTSITVLEALLAYEQSGGQVEVGESMRAGRAFFLEHRLYRSHRTGEVVDRAFTRFPFPPQWHFDVMRGLEHFRLAGAERDARLEDAVEAIRSARRADGTWPTYRPYPGRQWFGMESPGPSRWSTLRSLRILDWWDQPV